MANQWFRMYSEFANDPKIQMLSEANQRRYVMLLCLRCNGDVTLHDDEVTFQLRITGDEWAETKALFLAKNLITADNKPAAWDKRQYVSDSSTARVASHRARMKLEGNEDVTSCNVTVTSQNRTEQNRTEVIVSHDKIVFDGNGFKNINGQLKVWQTAYPAIDVLGEINKAAAWLMANPKNRKSNYERFLNGWFSRAQDRAPAKGSFNEESKNRPKGLPAIAILGANNERT